MASIFGLVLELDGWWLVVEREYRWIVFHLIHASQLIFVALGLNGDPHFATCVDDGNIFSSAANATRGGRRLDCG